LYINDNINVKIPLLLNSKKSAVQLREYETWLKERNIKYTLVYVPIWDTAPASINMRNEDALVFKMVFGL
jgi:hypothetical protein